MSGLARCIPAAVALSSLLSGAWPASAIAQPAPGAQTARDQPAVLAVPALPQAATGRSGDVFRSVDENGTPTFSQVRPAGRAATPLELKPLAGTIESAKLPRAARGSSPASPEAAAPVARVEPAPAAPAAVRGMPFETFIRIRRGMTEGELLGRAGPPDHRGNEINRGLLQESWYYLPTPSDPFTTVIQMRGGRVVDTDRIRRL